MMYDKIYFWIDVMVKWLWMIYVIFIIVEIVLLMIGGMSFFDVVCYLFLIMVIGGYFIK